MSDVNNVSADSGEEAGDATLVALLATQAKAHWDEAGAPYLLSKVDPDLKAQGVDYRSVLGERRLKEFVQSHAGDHFKVVMHPKQRAKIGLVPSDVVYEFDDSEESISTKAVVHHEARDSKAGALIAFLRALSELPDDDLDQVTIPTRVLVKLARRV